MLGRGGVGGCGVQRTGGSASSISPLFFGVGVGWLRAAVVIAGVAAGEGFLGTAGGGILLGDPKVVGAVTAVTGVPKWATFHPQDVCTKELSTPAPTIVAGVFDQT